MNVQEFRVGNYVFDEDGEVYQLRPIDIYNISVNPDCFNPIPLTEEWLLKFGFEDRQRGFFSIKAGSTFFRLTPPQFMGEWQTEYCWVYDDFKFTEIKYVHQLQNLYFALTGEELVFKN